MYWTEITRLNKVDVGVESMELLIIGICLGYLVGQIIGNKYKGKHIKRMYIKRMCGIKPDTQALTASKIIPPTGGSNVMPPIGPPLRELSESTALGVFVKDFSEFHGMSIEAALKKIGSSGE